MYIVQQGQMEVVLEGADGDVVITVLEPGEVFGEMALFTQRTRAATVRARGEVKVLTVDSKTFLRRVHEDPSLAFRVLQKMAERIKAMDEELLRLKNGDHPPC